LLSSEEGEKLLWFHQMGPLKRSKPMLVIFKHILLHVQVFLHNIVMLMEVEKDPKPFSKISKMLKHGLYLFNLPVMSLNHLPGPNSLRCTKILLEHHHFLFFLPNHF
jgi:hypothetical protein